MSQISKLVSQLCPNGVDHVSLESLFYLRKGENLTNNQAIAGEFPVITASRGSTFSHNNFNFDGECVTISSHGAYAGFVSYYNQKFWLGNNVYLFESKSDEISTRFYFHVLKSLAQALLGTVNTGGIPYINSKDLKRLRVPHPPIEIQNECVSLLDSFAELEAELEAELTSRTLQLEKYRDEAMSKLDDSNSRLMSLSECAGIFDGTHQTPTYTTEGIKFVSVENIDSLSTSTKFISKFDYETLYRTKPQKGDLLMTRIGSVGRCAVIDVDEPLAYYVSLALIKPHQDLISSSFIKHFLQSHSGRIELDKRTLHHAVPLKINLGDLGKVLIRVPDLKTQTNLASLFDQFEELLHSRAAGISAEVFGRRQQYEYYRAKILTFKELEVV
jgi:type I restriction enzyme S subunit